MQCGQATGVEVEDYLELERRAVDSPHAEALRAPGRETIPYSALWKHVQTTSERLADAGVRPGSVVALALSNGPEFLSATLAITLRWACAPVELDLTPDECRRKLVRIQASTLLVEDGVNSSAVQIARELGMRIVHVRCSPAQSAGVFELGGTEEGSRDFQGRQSEAALILMTSATTDVPKLVPRSRMALRTAALYNIQAFELTAADRYLNLMPLIHSHGTGEAMAQLAAGGAVCSVPSFEVGQFGLWLEEFGPTWFSASPTMNRLILTLASEDPEVFHRCPLRFVRSASAAPDPEMLVELERILRVPVLDGYGMTEVASATRNTPLHRKAGSVGTSCGAEIGIMDDSGHLLPPETEGEVVFRGPTVMSGYLDNPEANRAAFDDGWFRTGDLGRLDQDGFLFLVGRRKEIINRGGKKISPFEVDQALAKHGAVAEAATFAIAHRSLGEDVAAAVVLRPGAKTSELELRQFAARQLSAYKTPRRIVFVESIPRTKLGKPKRTELTRQFQARRPEARTHRPPSDIERRLADLWRRILDLPEIGIEDDFFDLGGDSLSASLMLAQAERIVSPEEDPARSPAPSLIDASDFYYRPTIASLAEILTKPRDGHAHHDHNVVILEEHGSRDPFFCFSSSTSNPYELRHLSRELGPDQPFITLLPFIPTQEQRLLRVSGIARQAIESIRAIRRHGPYRIGGYCYGGVLAFETARLLMEEGERVTLLALFDTPTPGYPKIARAWSRYGRRAQDIVHQLARGERSITLRDIADHARALGRIVTRRWFAKANRLIANAGFRDLEAPEEWKSVVMREYSPHPIHAPIVHFLAGDVPVSTTVLSDRRLGWRDFAKAGFQVVRVPGDHVSMLAGVNAPVLAAELEEVLRAGLSAEAEPRSVLT